MQQDSVVGAIGEEIDSEGVVYLRKTTSKFLLNSLTLAPEGTEVVVGKDLFHDFLKSSKKAKLGCGLAGFNAEAVKVEQVCIKDIINETSAAKTLEETITSLSESLKRFEKEQLDQGKEIQGLKKKNLNLENEITGLKKKNLNLENDIKGLKKDYLDQGKTIQDLKKEMFEVKTSFVASNFCSISNTDRSSNLYIRSRVALMLKIVSTEKVEEQEPLIEYFNKEYLHTAFQRNEFSEKLKITFATGSSVEDTNNNQKQQLFDGFKQAVQEAASIRMD